MMNIKSFNESRDIIKNYILKQVSDLELDYDLKIFEEGLVNSLFAIELMTFLEKTFQIKIKLEDLDMENFQSVNSIANFIKQKVEGGINA